MDVELLFYSPRWLVINAIRTCWKSIDGSDDFGENDQKLVKNIIRKGHLSTTEHSLYTYYIRGMSRAALQEVARHRIGIAISVESTRYTLKRILNDKNNEILDSMIDTTDEKLNDLIKNHLKNLKNYIIENGIINDIAKYGITENYPVTFQYSFNIRSLRHFIGLRSSKAAHFEIRELANKFANLIPDDHKIFFEDLL